MEHRVFLTGSGISPVAREHLTRHGCVLETGDPKDGPADLLHKLADFEPHALIVRQGRITGEVQGASPCLRVICKHGVGTDNIDLAAASHRGIPVFYTPNANFESVAEHTLALLFALSRLVSVQDRRVRAGVYDKKSYGGLELGGKTLGLVGFGKVARRVAELVAPLRMSVLAYHPSRTEEGLPDHIRKVAEVRELLASADAVSLHCPLTDETRRMIDSESLTAMKPGVLLVNTARGELVDEAALLEALNEGRVRGAALDVLQTEPAPPDHPLLAVENVIVTPHVAGASDRSLVNMAMQSADHVLSFLTGGPIDRSSLRNPEVLERR